MKERELNEPDRRKVWFGEPPGSWPVVRNKHVMRLVSETVGSRSSDLTLLSLTNRGVIARDMESGKGKFPASFDTYQLVRDGDLVFCLFDIDETPRTVGLSPLTGMITGAYSVFRPTPRAIGSFLSYFYHSIDDRKGLRPFYTGLRKVVRNDTFLSLPIPLPDLPTQKAIAAFLDRETARIDQLIEKKQRLVKLLGEQATARLEELLMPCQLVPLRRMVDDVTNGTTANQVQQEINTVPVTRIETVSSGIIDWAKVGHIERSEAKDKYLLRQGDILFSHINSLSVIGNTALYKHDPGAQNLYVGMNLLRLRPQKDVNPEFLLAGLRSMRTRHAIRCFAKPAINQASISIGNLLRVLVPRSNDATQDVLAQQYVAIREETASLQQKVRVSIDRLKEYRSALITAAVTGQIDVENWSRRGEGHRRLHRIEEEMAG